MARWPWFRRNRVDDSGPRGTYVVEAEIHRTEELRTALLGVPSEGEVRDDVPHDPWRPSRTLGEITYRYRR